MIHTEDCAGPALSSVRLAAVTSGTVTRLYIRDCNQTLHPGLQPDFTSETGTRLQSLTSETGTRLESLTSGIGSRLESFTSKPGTRLESLTSDFNQIRPDQTSTIYS